MFLWTPGWPQNNPRHWSLFLMMTSIDYADYDEERTKGRHSSVLVALPFLPHIFKNSLGVYEQGTKP